jgi:hypothetical protein
LNFNGAPGTVFNNFGTFRKSAGTGITTFQAGVLFNQPSGVLDVQQGELELQGGGNFTAGYITTNSTGTTYFSSGSFNLNGTATGTNVIENGGNLIGTNIIHGGLTWQDGSWANTVVTVSSNSLLNINGTVNYAIGGCILTNFGTLNWRGGALLAGGGSLFCNYGLWNAQDDRLLWAYNGSEPAFTNYFYNFGTFRKSAGTGTTTVTTGINFFNTGAIDAQSGDIALQGFYSLANGTKMSFGLGGPAGNGSITLSGAAVFTGSLSVNLNGFYWPAVGSSFNLLNYSVESGVLFTNTTLPAFITWQTNYNPTAFTLSVVARSTNPARTNLTMTTLNGTNLLLQWPGDHTGWTIQAQTNPLTIGLNTNWATVPGSALTNMIYLPVGKTNGSVFFRMSYP